MANHYFRGELLVSGRVECLGHFFRCHLVQASPRKNCNFSTESFHAEIIKPGQISSRPHTTDFPQMVMIVREIPGYFREI